MQIESSRMTHVLSNLRPFVLPLTLILMVCAVLLAFDRGGDASSAGIQRVAIVQHVSQGAIDAGVKGMRDALASEGFVDGKNIRLTMYNAQGDLPTANDIARKVTDGSSDLVITASTLSMQIVANVNRQSKVRHVFGIVSDAASAQIGVGAEPLDHPPWLTGYTSLASVPNALKLARELNPGLRRVGLIWHTSELSSQIYTRETRKACAQMGIELLEANAENPTEVGQAAQALVARGIDAFLITGDVVVLVAADSVIKAARAGRIPVLTVIPPTVRKGTLFDLGLDYEQVGRNVGVLAAKVLSGTSPATLPIINLAPETFYLNLTALEGLRDRWQVSDAIKARAVLVIDKDGEHLKAAAR